MDVKATLLPGANGTKALLREYGDQLVCVRYRYDKKRHKRYKTVETHAPSATLKREYSYRSVTVKPNSGNCSEIMAVTGTRVRKPGTSATAKSWSWAWSSACWMMNYLSNYQICIRRTFIVMRLEKDMEWDEVYNKKSAAAEEFSDGKERHISWFGGNDLERLKDLVSKVSLHAGTKDAKAPPLLPAADEVVAL
ncbi:MAG: hypothetical protein BMS9Abin08_0987 [Gammaproteobacteria bacterium]|nr:MAG: hypothetical protein BMS9Abin08_0987 [Gammaproteobacteria bacterium]